MSPGVHPGAQAGGQEALCGGGLVGGCQRLINKAARYLRLNAVLDCYVTCGMRVKIPKRT